MPLYEALYRCIRDDILSGRLQPGEKLPSKRALATNLEVSKITVEGAYEQLLSEGFICSVEKVGYFVEKTDPGFYDRATKNDVTSQNFQKNAATKNDKIFQISEKPEEKSIDLTANFSARFPFSVWSRLQREVMLDLGEKLLSPVPNQGLPELRNAISRQLREFRGMEVDPDNILIGAGTDFLYNLLIQLLGRDKTYAVEEPGYSKIRLIYAAGGVRCVGAPMDRQGVRPETLGDADILHISPSHHFPSGIVTTPGRRQALLQWAKTGEKWIIEDDYDTEFRFSARPTAAMYTMDRAGKVIYMNTFSKTLASPIRISYMVLPPRLMETFRKTLGFYSCTVPSFEQYTLARFLEGGHFEKHINRMRKLYKNRRNRILDAIETCPQAGKMEILEENAGLHFLLKISTQLTDAALTQRFLEAGIRVRSLGSYYHDPAPREDTHILVINYSALTDQETERLEKIFRGS
ncbi:MAG: PLP-dependent aminotransferase family protein [Oscillospiraceae bacterium]|nr:PLP-dependent aminotransferase family protein [Oscillospiraceae bacterium]